MAVSEEQLVVGRLRAFWRSQADTTSVEQKDAVGRLYLKAILGADDDLIRRFLEGDLQADADIGQKQSAVPVEEADFAAFWDGVVEIFPDVYSHEDIEFLKERGMIEAAFELLWALQPYPRDDSPVLKAIRVNAHAWK